ncbi:SGNH/GDSL hydrolase family protein [Candidatus Gracilibacteria bacterium]|nr:SGNH/GDSL hydrolase family protein [Candidatus Gracilibacteria bacterium]
MHRKHINVLLFLTLSFVVLALPMGLLFWFLGQPVAARSYNPQGPGDSYLALGDSLAWGASLDDPATQSYPALIYAELNAMRPIDADNLAVPGETSSSFLRRQLPRAITLIEAERAAGRLVSPITLDIGGNDLRAAERASPEERAAVVAAARQNIAVALDQLREAAGDAADIAVMTYYNPYGGETNIVNSEAYWVDQLNQAIRAEAAQRGVAVADAFTPFEGGRAFSYTYILLGDIHANAQGHRVIADQFLAALAYE